MDSAKSIYISWESDKNATLYKLKLSSFGLDDSIITSNDSNILLDPGTLESSSEYMVVIESQRVTGDPFFQDENFYTFSYETSPEYYFFTN